MGKSWDVVRLLMWSYARGGETRKGRGPTFIPQPCTGLHQNENITRVSTEVYIFISKSVKMPNIKSRCRVISYIAKGFPSCLSLYIKNDKDLHVCNVICIFLFPVHLTLKLQVMNGNALTVQLLFIVCFLL